MYLKIIIRFLLLHNLIKIHTLSFFFFLLYLSTLLNIQLTKEYEMVRSCYLCFYLHKTFATHKGHRCWIILKCHWIMALKSFIINIYWKMRAIFPGMMWHIIFQFILWPALCAVGDTDDTLRQKFLLRIVDRPQTSVIRREWLL